MARTSGVTLCAVVILGVLSLSQGSGSGLEAQLDYRWEAATLVEDSTWNACYPEIAVDASGNAIAVWSQWDGDRYNIWSNRYVIGDGWGTAVKIETNDSGGAYWPKVAMDDSGNAIVVWTHDDGTCRNVWSNRYVIGDGWGTAVMIETNDSGDAGSLQIAVDASGNAIVVWHQLDMPRTVIWWNRYVAGTGWGVAARFEINDALYAIGQRIAMDTSGNAMVVWEQEDSDAPLQNIWCNRYVVGAGWEEAAAIQTSDSEVAFGPEMAVDGSGNAAVVWVQDDGVRSSVWSNRYLVGAGWETPTLVGTDDSGSTWGPKIALDGSGNATAIWGQSDGVHVSVWSNRYVVGAGWGTAGVIESYDSGDACSPQIAVDSAGNAVAVWVQDDGHHSDIVANRYVFGADWQSPEKIETEDLGDAIYPVIASDPSGNVTVVWHQEDMYNRANIWSNRYVQYDAVPPSIEIANPLDGLTTESQAITVSGSTEPGADLTINGISAFVDSDGSFSFMIVLVEGVNSINVTATDASENSATVILSVTYVDPISRLEAELDDVKLQNLILASIITALVALTAIMSVAAYTLRRRIADLKTEPTGDEKDAK